MGEVVKLFAPRRLVGINELCVYLNGKWDTQALYRLRKLGKIPGRKKGGKIIFDLDEIDAWLTADDAPAPEPCISKFQQARQRLLSSLTTEATQSHSRARKKGAG